MNDMFKLVIANFSACRSNSPNITTDANKSLTTKILVDIKLINNKEEILEK